MKSVFLSCQACGAVWEVLRRQGERSVCCETCGSKRLDEKSPLFATKAQGEVSRVPRSERIEGLARLLGIKAVASARASGDWNYRQEQGDDPDDLEREYWYDAYQKRLLAALAKEDLRPGEEELDVASTAFSEGWQSGRPAE